MKFTKHFYIEGQRIVSKLGDMGKNQDLLNPKDTTRAGNNGNHPIDWDNKQEHLKDFLLENFEELGLTGAVFTAGKSGKIPYGQLKKYYRNTNGIIDGYGSDSINARNYDGNKAELSQFYYHPDHLGSSNYITNVSGEVYQHMEYFPFGETFIEERTDAEYTTYLYNGKEFDEEIGLYYYGARYYDPRISMFYGVDPMAEDPKNISISPYAYVSNNPIRLNDPTGMIWVDPSEAKNLQDAAQNRINQYEKSNDRLDKRIDNAAEKGNNNKVARLSGRKSNNNKAIGELQSSITQIDEMGKDQNFTFEFKKVSGDGEHHINKASNENIVIEYSSTAIQLHETRHAYQYMKGGAFQFNSSGQLAPTDITFWADAEKSAYRVQHAYSSSSMPTSDYGLRNIYSVNHQYVGGIKGTSKRLYPYKKIGEYDKQIKLQYMLRRQTDRRNFIKTL
jgi:RHS repeat-associated protein